MHPAMLPIIALKGFVWFVNNVLGVEDEATEVTIGFEHLDEEPKQSATVYIMEDFR